MSKPAVFTEKKLISMSVEMVSAISDYRFNRRLPSETEAIRQLVELALDLVPLCADLLDAIEYAGEYENPAWASEAKALDSRISTDRQPRTSSAN